MSRPQHEATFGKQSIYNPTTGKQERSSGSPKHQNERPDIPQGHTNFSLHTNTSRLTLFDRGSRGEGTLTPFRLAAIVQVGQSQPQQS
jgi:hypothetical protein